MLKEILNPNADLSAIDTVIAAFFNLFTNTGGHAPALDTIYDLCIPETVIIKKTGLSQEVYTLENFIAPRKKILADGTLKDFLERETESETKIIHHLAQRFSIYEKSGSLHGTHFHTKGKKIFQLVKTEEGWRISSLAWEDDLA